MLQPSLRELLHRVLVLHALGHDLQLQVVGEVDRRAHDERVARGWRPSAPRTCGRSSARSPAAPSGRRATSSRCRSRRSRARCPSRAGGPRTSIARFGSIMIVLSVISSSRSSTGIPHLVRSFVTSSGSVGSSRLRADRLTEIFRSSPASRHSRHCASALVEHVAAQRPDQAGALGHRHELGGEDQAALGVLPAHQRLGAHHLAGLQVDLGLVVEQHLVLGEPLAQLPDHGEADRVVGVVLDRVDLVTAVRALGLVHGHVGVLEQRVHVLAVLRVERDAHARVHVHRQPVDVEVRLERARGSSRRPPPRRPCCRASAAARRTRRLRGGRSCRSRAASPAGARRCP